MKEVLILIPEGIDTQYIYYMRRDSLGDIRFVKPLVARQRSDISEEEFNEHVKAMHSPTDMPHDTVPSPSRKEFDALCIRVQRLELLTTSYQPTAEEGSRIVGCSDEEIKELRKRIKEFSAEAVMPLAPTAYPSREEFEALLSRVEKLERESKRQCARVIKMEEGISDDLK